MSIPYDRVRLCPGWILGAGVVRLATFMDGPMRLSTGHAATVMFQVSIGVRLTISRDAMLDWRHLIREIPDFPKAGVLYRDITPVLADADAFVAAIDAMAESWRGTALDAIVAIESRGFILGAALARTLGLGFVPVRKAGRLPSETLVQDYVLEYGEGRMEIHRDALDANARVILVDDVLASGGTLLTALSLVRRQGALVVGASVLVELSALHGRQQWKAQAGNTPLLAATRFRH